MWADAGVASITHNMGMEGSIGQYKAATVNCNAKQNSGYFMATSCKFIQDKSEETYDKFSKLADALYSFPKHRVHRNPFMTRFKMFVLSRCP